MVLPDDLPKAIKGKESCATNKQEGEYYRPISWPSTITHRICCKLESYREKKKSAEYRKERREIWTLIGVFLTAAFVLGQGIIFYCQLRVFKKTDQTLTNTMINGQRAYLSIDTMAGLRHVADNVLFTVKNFGQTPAKRVRITSNLEFVGKNEELPANFTFPDRPVCGTIQSRNSNLGTIFPNNPPLAWRNICPDQAPVYALVEKGERAGYLYGHIDYVDIFDSPRRTNFCFSITAAVAVICDRYNDIDP